MEKIGHFYKLLSQSNVALLGYSFRQERIKDELISKIPHIEIGEISSSFSFKSFLRDVKLCEILDGKPTSDIKWIILDINNISTSSPVIGERQKIIKIIVSKIQSDILNTNYKLLITTPLYMSPTSSNTMNNLTGGTTPLYVSDIVAVISEKEQGIINKGYNLNIIKNRHDSEKVISLDGLENYKYICDNYPHFI